MTMVETQIPGLTILGMILALVASVVIPLILFLVLKIKFKGKFIPFLFGALTMLIWALTLEQIMHTVVFISPVGSAIQGNIWLYGLYGALAAATFEEIGRYITMRFLLKKEHDNKITSVMYGAGHGGFECMYLLGIGMISNLAVVAMVRSGAIVQMTATLGDAELEQVNALITAIQTTSIAMFGVSVLERLFAITAQIAMSVAMWQAAAKNKKLFFIVVFAMHFCLDFLAVIVNNYFGIAVTECIIGTLSVVYIIIVCVIYKKTDK